MGKDRDIRLLVDWKDGFANFGPREAAPAPVEVGRGRDVRLLVDWKDGFSNVRPREPMVALPAGEIELESDLRLLVSWTDELALARRRETTMAAVILHLVAILVLLFTPRLFPETQQTPEEAEEQTRHALALLYIPSDVLKPPPPITNLTPEERRRAVTRPPLVVDPKELQKILPPRPPSPETQLIVPPGGGLPVPPGQPGNPGGEKSDRRDSSPPASARLEDLPRPQSGQPKGLELPPSRPGRAIEEALKRGQQGGTGGAGGTPGDQGGPMQPNLNVPYPTILSDTRGVDFAPYLARLVAAVRRNWYAIMPESVYWGEKGKVVIVFSILKDGSVPQGQPAIVGSSSRVYLDRPAVGAIRASQPFAPLPSEFTGDKIVLQFTFLYNLPADYTGP